MRSLAALCFVPSVALAQVQEPWTDADPPHPPERHAQGDFGFRVGAEYRAQWLLVEPVSLNTETARNVNMIQQRLRLDAAGDYQDKVKIVFSTDVFDGDLWGDNGSFGGTPSALSGTAVDAKNPNDTRPCIGLRSGQTNAISPDAYGVTLCPIAPLVVRRLYGEVHLPFGLLRVGRQPVLDGMGVFSTDGEGRHNRFGIAGTGNYVDRVLFATKPLEAFKKPSQRDLTATRGLFVGVAFDEISASDPQSFGVDVHQLGGGIRYAEPKVGPFRDFFATAYVSERWQEGVTAITGIGGRVYARVGRFRAGLDAAMNIGETSEISEAYQKITGDPVVSQKVLQGGARATLRYDWPRVGLYLEGDYASGSDDPTSRATLSQFTWAPDTNVGLLLFKQVLGFQTGRVAAAGNALLARLGATTFPTQALDTQGAVTNAMVIFPQADFKPVPNLLIRPGVMFAWTAVPLINPVASLQNHTSVNLADNEVNYAGGKPGRFYGAELDLRLEYRFLEHFIFDVEGAVLFPGDALQDIDGYAVTSWLLQTRATFFL